MANIYDMTDTWNASGTTFSSIKMTVTNTAYAAASQLVNVVTGSTQRFGVRAPHNALGADVTPFLNMEDVWNTSGNAIGIKYNVTATASGSSSLVMQLQVAGSNVFTVSKNGAVTAISNMQVGAASGYIWGGRSILASPANGTVRMTNQAENGFTSLQLGTATAAGFLSVPAATTAIPHMNLTAGVAPTSPANGDIWFDGTDIKMRIGGVTKTFTLI